MASRTREKLERLYKRSSSDGPSREEGLSPPSGPEPRPGLESLSRLEQALLGEETSAEALSVKERLERLVRVTTRERLERLAGREDSQAGPARPAVSLDEALSGSVVENEHGAFYRVDHELPLEHYHGKTSLSRLRLVSPSAISILARHAENLELDLERTVFLDTETTGISGGSGTCAFLVGLGYVEGDRFHVRQLFMRDYAEEAAMLTGLAELLGRFESLVTFNGKSFDVPLLESRFVLSRLRYSLSELPHFDLLHPARSLWKARLDRCRLVDLEYVLLDLERQDDVPGDMIPGLYFDYVRSREASRIFHVFSHNRYDILSLAALTIVACEMLEEEASPDHPLDDLSLGRLFERAAMSERSMRHYERVLESGIPGTARRRALRQLALHHKRRGQWDEAVTLWNVLSRDETLGAFEAIEALEELAMVREHREKDFGAALDCCQRAIERLDDDVQLSYRVRERYRAAFEHRRGRLRGKRSRRGRGVELAATDASWEEGPER